MNYRVLLGLTFIVLIVPVKSFAQTGLMKTTADYFHEVLFLDCVYEEHVYNKIDDERIRIKYDCGIGFQDNLKEKLYGKMILQVGSTHSKFTSPILHAADSAMMAKNDRIKFTLFKNASPIFDFFSLYTDLTTGEVIFDERMITEDFEYIDNPPVIDWKISNDVETILNHKCVKAVGEFRGRLYEAWFTEDIPVSAGPWKLRGLPGVILKARESDGACEFEATSILEGNGIIEKPDYPYIKVSIKEYHSLLKQYLKAPGKFSSLHMSRTPGIKPSPIPGYKEKPIRPFVILEKD